MACMTSGFAGVFFEMMLKSGGGNTSVWIRNVQLGELYCMNLHIVPIESVHQGLVWIHWMEDLWFYLSCCLEMLVVRKRRMESL